METKENFGIYVHFPFCRRKCIYCDFYSVGGKTIDWDRFVMAVENEYEARRAGEVQSGAIVSLYFGGGTPSLAPLPVIERLRRMVGNEVGEFTIEVNPDDVDEEKARGWAEAGVNRISMGVQSLDDNELKSIWRHHDSAGARKAFDILRKYFSNISLDLMFGLPGQTLETLASTIDGFLAMRPEHISAYSLMYEERTALTRLRDLGKVEEADENLSVEMFRMLSDRLREAGYERYEISNYSLPGFRSHHNSNYWKGMPYIGLGPSAHSYDGVGIRRSNKADLVAYQKEWLSDNGNNDIWKSGEIIETEILTDEERKEEMILTRLRMAEGLDLRMYRESFGDTECARLMGKSRGIIEKGWLYIRGDGSLALTDEGVMVSDEVILGLF